MSAPVSGSGKPPRGQDCSTIDLPCDDRSVPLTKSNASKNDATNGNRRRLEPTRREGRSGAQGRAPGKKSQICAASSAAQLCRLMWPAANRTSSSGSRGDVVKCMAPASRSNHS